MSAEAKIMEAILRVEHKLDLVLTHLKAESKEPLSFEKLGSSFKSCPVCEQPIQYDVDITDAVVVRKCGCSTGKIALDFNKFAPPTLNKKDDEDDRDLQEDWRNPDRGRGKPRRG